ncbi:MULTISPECIES: Pvc16 family protein [Chromobacterium]|uniref:Pvc16 family protein n=1 Tax=Chromobacterium TaxID=535 RepID=UPI001D06513F|nr:MULTISPECIES: Pvc16 family protein [Chromobacterium]MCP1293307.1 DUF4255 domain-containing protein [Chromobacterium sp. S0633]UJB32731.1 DUF4255 domain-containing protein [Chromobacterium sp. Beijing]
MNTTLSWPMYSSDETLLELNKCVEAAIQAYLPDGVEVCFDIPDPETPPATPTVSVFMYAIQEDLELRTGIARQFMGMAMSPGYINIKCEYLVTYWEQSIGDKCEGPQARAASTAMTALNWVLNALINNRELNGMPGAYIRVITPNKLNELSNFWQALGNKPRLCLNFSATVAVTLRDAQETYAPIQSNELMVAPKEQ